MTSVKQSPSVETYEIEKILSRRSRKSGTEYLIKWKKFAEEDQNTWEPLSKLIEDQAYEAISFYESQCLDTPPKDVTLFLMSYKETTLKVKENKEIIDSEEDIDNQMEEDWITDFGSFPQDSIKRIIKLEMNNQNKTLYGQIEWNRRSLTGIKPPTSFVKTSKLKKHCLRFYLDFLEGVMYTDK